MNIVTLMVGHLSSDDAAIETKATAKDAASFTKDKPVDEEGGATKNLAVKVGGSSSDPEEKPVHDEEDGTKAKEDAASSTKEKPAAVDEERGDSENVEVEGGGLSPDSHSEKKPLVENDEEAVTITESMWPPFRVRRNENNPSDRNCAHVVFSVLLLIFCAVSAYTFWKAYTTENLSSSIRKEVFKFPVVTICGPEAEFERTTELGEYNQCHVWDETLRPDQEYNGTSCDSAKAENGLLGISYMEGVKPCFVYNPNRTIDTRTDGSLSLTIQFDAVLSDSESELGGTSDYPMFNRQYPDYFTLFLSDADLSQHANITASSFWNYIQIPTSGNIFFNVNLAKQDSSKGASKDVYTIENYVHFPWKEAMDDDEQNELTSRFTEIWLSSSEAGVSHITLVPVSLSVLLGSLWGLFGLVFTVFYVCFSKDVEQPRFLVRRIRGLKECTKADAQVLAGVGHDAADISGAKSSITKATVGVIRSLNAAGKNAR